MLRDEMKMSNINTEIITKCQNKRLEYLEQNSRSCSFNMSRRWEAARDVQKKW